MSVAATSEVLERCQSVRRGLEELIASSEVEIGALTGGFRELSQAMDGILGRAASIVSCVEGEQVQGVLPRVRRLGEVARSFIGLRGEATTSILETASNEARLLEKLTQLTQGQRSVARETKTLSVLTNIEVARLGQLGAGFQYLAHELDGFSQAVVDSTKQLAGHTEERRSSISGTQRRLAASLPRIREELERISGALEEALAGIDRGQARLSEAPVHFRLCVGELAGQIAGVVAAVQGHDITRQQLEHVRDSLAEMGQQACQIEAGEGAVREAGRVVAGLRVQCAQLRDASATVTRWIAQIHACLDGMERVSSSGLTEIGALVLEQEAELEGQLSQIEELERACERDDEEVQAPIQGLSSLMELVGEHLGRSREVRERLQLLTFNSIVEASRLGTKADAILEISQSIKRIAGDWSAMTDSSALVMEEILALVEEARSGIEACSVGGRNELTESGAESRRSLEALGQAARFVGSEAGAIEGAIEELRKKMAGVAAAAERLEGCFRRIEQTHEQLEACGQEWERDWPGAWESCDRAAIEAAYSSAYSFERERQILRSVLYDEAIPELDTAIAGNDVELF